MVHGGHFLPDAVRKDSSQGIFSGRADIEGQQKDDKIPAEAEHTGAAGAVGVDVEVFSVGAGVMEGDFYDGVVPEQEGGQGHN